MRRLPVPQPRRQRRHQGPRQLYPILQRAARQSRGRDADFQSRHLQKRRRAIHPREHERRQPRDDTALQQQHMGRNRLTNCREPECESGDRQPVGRLTGGV